MRRTDFAAALAPVFADDPAWLTDAAASLRPFPTVTALHQALFDELLEAPAGQQLAFLRAHPDLAAAAARQRRMGATAAAEPATIGLDRLDDAAFARFAAMNDAYRGRFGFPFLICVRRHTRASILRHFARRLGADPDSERAAALEQVFHITRLRIAALVEGPGRPETTGLLSTHVLDTAAGTPAAGVKVELFLWEDGATDRLRTALTGPDGRVPALLGGDGPLPIGTYELRFHLGPYFAAQSDKTLPDPPFLDTVPIRIGIAEPEAHYHVPLLASPFAYSTYRGG